MRNKFSSWIQIVIIRDGEVANLKRIISVKFEVIFPGSFKVKCLPLDVVLISSVHNNFIDDSVRRDFDSKYPMFASFKKSLSAKVSFEMQASKSVRPIFLQWSIMSNELFFSVISVTDFQFPAPFICAARKVTAGPSIPFVSSSEKTIIVLLSRYFTTEGIPKKIMKRTKRTDCKIDVKQNPGVARIVGFATSYFEQFCLVAYQGLTSSFEGGFELNDCSLCQVLQQHANSKDKH